MILTPRRYARAAEVEVYGPHRTPGYHTVHTYAVQPSREGVEGWKWTKTGERAVHHSNLDPKAVSVNQANRLGIAHGNPVTAHHRSLLINRAMPESELPVAQEIPENPNAVKSPTPPRLSAAPRRKVTLPERPKPAGGDEEAERVFWTRRLRARRLSRGGQ